MGAIVGASSAAANNQNVIVGTFVGGVAGFASVFIAAEAVVSVGVGIAIGISADFSSQLVNNLLEGKSLFDINLISVAKSSIAGGARCGCCQ